MPCGAVRFSPGYGSPENELHDVVMAGHGHLLLLSIKEIRELTIRGRGA